MNRLTLEQVDQIHRNQLTSYEIIMLKLRATLTLQEIADLVGLSKQRVAIIIDAAMAKLEIQRAVGAMTDVE